MSDRVRLVDPAACLHGLAEAQRALAPQAVAAAADRCLSCADAPCVAACPTGIDVPGFIGAIRNGDPAAAARRIFERNILGGMCARVCPVDVLCEGACVRAGEAGGAVEIARLQRHATDHAMAQPGHPVARAAATGLRVAVVGAGPAGLACAHGLARRGHDVVLMDARDRAGGLNEYAIATWKVPTGYAEAEVAWLLRIGGIELRTGQRLGRELSLAGLEAGFDAVFLGIGLAGVNALRVEGEEHANVRDAVDFIAEVRQASPSSRVAVGRDVVVIGGGTTAVDAAVQARLLGAERVTLVCRDVRDRMSASTREQNHAASKGVRIVTGAVPRRILADRRLEAVEFVEAGGRSFRIPADQVFKAIGQHLAGAPEEVRLEGDRIAITGPGRTSRAGVWAGGDCATGREALTVTAVAQGRDAAEDIHAHLGAARGR